MISKELKCIFIHIPKTAGTSIEKKLGHFQTLEYNVQDHRILSDLEKVCDRRFQLRLAAYSLKKGNFYRILPNIKKAISPELTRNEFDTFFKFAVVRNSWARAYSWYKVAMRDAPHRESYGIPDDSYSFKSFLKEKMNHKEFSQMRYIKDRSGQVPLDFVCRFENLSEDFKKVADRLGLKNAELPQLLVHDYEHYSKQYDDESKDLVRQHYKEEIRYFGFKFGE